mgnify:CR=1 FL=1
MARVESAVRNIIELNKAFNSHDHEKMLGLFSEDIRFEDVLADFGGVTYRGSNKVAQYFKDRFQQYPGIYLEQEELFSLGTRCILRWKVSLDIKSPESDSFRGISLFQVRNGSVTEIVSYAR